MARIASIFFLAFGVHDAQASYTYVVNTINSNKCSEGSEVVTDESECRKAAATVSGHYQSAGTWKGYPGGCYGNPLDSRVWLNKDAGAWHLGYAKVCRKNATWVDDLFPSPHDANEYPMSWPLSIGRLSLIFQQLANLAGINASTSRHALPILPSVSFPEFRTSDGVKIWTMVVEPHSIPETKRKGTMLVKSPYGPTSQMTALIYMVLNGFTAVMQDQRGTFFSEGTYDLWRAEAQDTKETLEWIVQQPWSNGDVYMMGISADGASVTLPEIEGSLPMLKGQWAAFTVDNGHRFVYPQGSWRKDLTEKYLGIFDKFSRGAMTSLAEIKAHEGFGPFWYNDTVCYNVSAPSDPTPPGCRYSNVKWPIIDSVGWWDIFQQSQLGHWRGVSTMSDLSVRDKHVLIVGPMGHCAFGLTSPLEPVKELATATAVITAGELASEFFAGSFDGHVRSRIGRVNFFLMRSFSASTLESAPGDYWVSGDDFPTATPQEMFLAGKGVLATAATTESGMSTFTYDPTSPTPMLGGNNLMFLSGMSECGTADMTKRNKRGDVLVWTSEPLQEDLAVVGQLTATLFVSSSAIDTDFAVTVEDVCKDTCLGDYSYLVRYGMQRMRWRDGDIMNSEPLAADDVYEITVDLWTTAYVFPKKHSIRITVASALYPFYDANPNTGDSVNATEVVPVVAQNAVHFASEFPSRLTLPVVAMVDLKENKQFGPTLPVLEGVDSQERVV